MAGKFTLTKALPFLCSLLRRRRGPEGSLVQARNTRPAPPPPRTCSSSQAPEIRYDGSRRRAVVCDVEGGLLRSSSTFPYFMLVALESGGLLRAVLLLLLSPFLWFLGEEVGTKVMAVVCFCGVKEEGFALGRTVLPKHMLEDVGLEGLRLLLSAASGEGKKKLPVLCVTSMPRVMVESTVKEYLGVDAVVGREMKVVGGYYTGLMTEEEYGDGPADDAYSELLGAGDRSGDGGGVLLWVGGRKKIHRRDRLFFSKCTQWEVIAVDEADKRLWRKLPREMYKKPLHFHDGRLAFRPTFPATLAMFLWLPLGFFVVLVRAASLLLVPYRLPVPILALTGMQNRVTGCPPPPGGRARDDGDGPPPRRGRGRLYACNHRSLFDPVYISGILGKTVTAVIYSVSRLTEVMSPIKVVRLERERAGDMKKMEAALFEGDLVVCPEGTTCREPYVLRFSPLFSEVAEGGVVPVAIDVRETMFRGTTATGSKWLDGIFFGLNPTLAFAAEFLEEVPLAKADGEGKSRYEVANEVQGKIAEALGYESSMLTRRDKYMVLAGTDGRVKKRSN